MKKGTVTGIIIGTVMTGGICLYDRVTGKDVLGKMRDRLSSFGFCGPSENVVTLDDEQFRAFYDRLSGIENEVAKTQQEVEAINKYMADDQKSQSELMNEVLMQSESRLREIRDAVSEIKTKA